MKDDFNPVDYFDSAIESGDFIEFSYKNVIYVISPLYKEENDYKFSGFSVGKYDSDNNRAEDKEFCSIDDLKQNCYIDGVNIIDAISNADYICEN